MPKLMQPFLFWSKGFARKPEIIRIAEMTGLTREVVAVRLMEFYEWADTMIEDGVLSGFNVRSLSAVCPLTDAQFWSAVEFVGWLIIKTDCIVIPNYDTWLGSNAKKRIKDATRRRTNRYISPACPDIVPLKTGQKKDKSGHRERERERDSKGMNSLTNPSCPETKISSSEPPVLTFPTDGKTNTWELTSAKLDEWARAFPSLDVLGECRKALQWLRDNPERRKTARGMPRFLFSWLERTNNRGGGKTGATVPVDRQAEGLRRLQEEMAKVEAYEKGLFSTQDGQSEPQTPR